MPEKSVDCFSFPDTMSYLMSLVLETPALHVPTELDQERFLDMVRRNRLTPLVAARLRTVPERMLADNPAFRQILADQAAAVSQALRQMRVLAFLMRDFSAAKIRALSLKGPMLAIKLYGDPTMRDSRDLDILVAPEDLTQACARLEAMGFTEMIDNFHKTPHRRAAQSHGGEEMHKVYILDGICVELHWRLTFRYAQDFESLWVRRCPRMLLGEAINCLEPTDELIYLICHGAGHGFSRLRWLMDLYECLRPQDTDLTALYERMRELGVAPLLLETLMLLYLMPGFQFPAISLAMFSMTPDGDGLHLVYDHSCRRSFHEAFRLLDALYPLLRIEQEAKGMTGRRYMQLLPTVNKRKTMLSYLWAVMQPCAADLARFDFPDQLYFLYYIVRPFYKLWRMTPFYRQDRGRK